MSGDPPTPPSPHRIGVLISGRGSNLMAILDRIEAGELDAQVAVVVCNEPAAAGIAGARARRVEVVIVDHRASRTREEHDRQMAAELESRSVGLVCLAGYMRLVGAPLLSAFPNRVLNIHPSLLPAFPGLDAQTQALEYGVGVSGATVHLVTDELDGGPIVVQAAVPVLPSDTAETLSARILIEEHRIYPQAIATVLDGEWRIEGRRFVSEPPASIGIDSARRHS